MNRWLDGLKRQLGFTKSKHAAPQRPRRRLCLEALEDRLAPAAGVLDPTFGTGGIVTASEGSTSGANGVAVQSDGKVVVAGHAQIGSVGEFALTRYNVDGTLDTTFGTGGKVTTVAGSYSGANSLAVQADGKLVAAGFAYNNSVEESVLVRYNANGSLDTSFGSGGIVTTAVGSSGSLVQSVVLQSDGKVVAAGIAFNGSTQEFALTRYNVDGSLDASFGSGGEATIAVGSSNSGAAGVAVQADGKVVAAGDAFNGSIREFALARYDGNGMLDTSFGSEGIVTTAIGSFSTAQSVAVQSDGRVVAAGEGNPSSLEFALARYNADGSLDTSFGSGGIVTTAVGSSGSFVESMAVQADGKLVAAGFATGDSGQGFALARYNPNGSLDTTFGTGGEVITALGPSTSAYGVAVQADGKVVAVGDPRNGFTSQFTVARYQGDPTVTVSAGSYASTTGVVQSSTASPYPGQSVTLSVRVGDAVNSADNGTVSFYDTVNGVLSTLGTGTTSGGVATLTVSGLAAGSHSITAAYGGNSYYTASSSASALNLSVAVGTNVSTTGFVRTSAAAPYPDEPVTLSVRVGDAVSTADNGTVTFFDTVGEVTTVLGTGTVSMGVASLTVSNLVAGSHSITAAYAGNSYYTASSSQSTLALPVTAGRNVSVTGVVQSSVAAPYPGQAVTLSVSVGDATHTADNGTVTFFDTVAGVTTVLGTGTVSGGVASLTVSGLTAGTHSITATYGGNSYYTAGNSSSALTLPIAAGSNLSTTSAVRSSMSTPYSGEPVTLSVMVGDATHTADNGTVTFYDTVNGVTTTLGTGTVTGGVASLTVSSFTAGGHYVTAHYAGNTYYTASDSL